MALASGEAIASGEEARSPRVPFVPTRQGRDADLSTVRAAINDVDERIVALIAERQAWVEMAGRLKRGQRADTVRAPARVEDVVSRVRALAASSGGSPTVVECTYRAMISAFIDLELGIHATQADLTAD